MSDKQDRLLKLDNDKLIDIVKNYRQYGYDELLREAAINILEDRGISKEQLQLTGSFENKTYDSANNLYSSFRKHSKIALVLYLILLLSRVLIPIVDNPNSVGFATALLIITVLAFVLYLVFLIKSFLNQNQFYKTIGDKYGTDGTLLYLFIGMPLYIVMYFVFQNQMKEKMKEIR